MKIKYAALIRATLCTLIISAAALPLMSQNDSYSHDFEDEQENSNWVLNAGLYGPDCVNKWMIDTAANNGGQRGLYISPDSGRTASYIASDLTVIAYRTLTLPAGNYELSFDWQAGDNTANALYCCWTPDDVSVYSSPNGSLPNFVTDYALKVSDSIKMTGSVWNSAYGSFISDGKPHKLLFAWNNGLSAALNPGACVDNISITPEGLCEKPYDINVSAKEGEITISWKGSADSYDIRYRIQDADRWNELYGITGNTITVKDNSGEGEYDFYIRAVCGDYHSVWVSHTQFIFYTGLRCVDYLDLNDKNCYYGEFADPELYRGVVNKGYKSIDSRHTIHSSKRELDPRTGNGLKTVPDDEIASVRLGNWDINSQAESVKYDYHVDASTSAIFLLKYAVVLQNPSGHGKEQQPRFTLEVTQDGKKIDKYGCGEADFSAGFDTDDWNVYPNPDDPSTPTLWKDWTTVGINLAEFDGEDLEIQLTTYDCSQSGHYGYAYFTIGCSDGKLQGVSCGENPVNSFTAPDGFNYRWYLKDKPDETIGESQTLEVSPNDTLTYMCDVIQPTNAQCYYTLEASAVPRWPVSEASYSAHTKDCSNIVDFTNDSYVMLVNQITGDTSVSSQQCESVLWDFGDGTTSTEWNPSHEYPAKGGSYKVTLQTGLANDLCLSTYEFTVELPELGTVIDTIDVYTCHEVPYKDANGNMHYFSEEFTDTVINPETGCRHITTTRLTMLDEMTGTHSDTVCTDDLPYVFNGKEYRETGIYTDTLTGRCDCDSIVTLDLLVNTSLDISFDTDITACADDGTIYIPFNLRSGIASNYSVTFAEEAARMMNVTDAAPVGEQMEIPIPDSLRPDIYTAQVVFDNADCGNVEQTLRFRIYYPDTIIIQRWNDVLGVRNSIYNGGYTFSAYQWYANGQPLSGATGPNLYLPDGLDAEAQYTVMLTRSDDGRSVFTCPIQPDAFTAVENVPVVTFGNGSISVGSKSACTARLWSVSGVLIGTYTLEIGETAIPVPSVSGIYILELTTDDGLRHIHKIITGY